MAKTVTITKKSASPFFLNEEVEDINVLVEGSTGVKVTTAGLDQAIVVSMENSGTSSSLKEVAAAYSAETANLQKNTVNLKGVSASKVYGGAVAADEKGKTLKKYNGIAVAVAGVELNIINGKFTTIYGAGAGYGSIVNGNVDINVKGGKINTIYGAGDAGSVVNGNININISGANLYENDYSIANIYAGGNNATVYGNVNVTFTSSARALKFSGVVSGLGKGKVASVSGDAKLAFTDYAGDFNATIKAFDTVSFVGATSVTMKKGQDKSMTAATYEFVVNDESMSLQGAMLTWNKKVTYKAIEVKIDNENAQALLASGATITLISSTYFKKASDFNVNSVHVVDDSGILASYSYDIVYDFDKKKGGTVSLVYKGTSLSLNGSYDKVITLTDASDIINITAEADIQAGINTAGGNDIVNVQTGASVKSDIALGTGSNELNIAKEAAVTGTIRLAANSENELTIAGQITGIKSGDSTTKNTIILNSARVGYYYTDPIADNNEEKDNLTVNDTSAVRWQTRFEEQALVLGDSNDTVKLYGNNYVASVDLGNGNNVLYINSTNAATGDFIFGNGNNTVVLNAEIFADGTHSLIFNSEIDKDSVNGIIVGKSQTVDFQSVSVGSSAVQLYVADGQIATVNGFSVGDLMSDNDANSGLILGQNSVVINGDASYIANYSGQYSNAEGSTLMVIAPQTTSILEYSFRSTGVTASSKIANEGNVILAKDSVFAGTIEGGTVVVGSSKVTGTVENATVKFADTGLVSDVKLRYVTLNITDEDIVTVGSYDSNGSTLNLDTNTALIATADKTEYVNVWNKDFAAAEGVQTVFMLGNIKGNASFKDGQTVVFDGDDVNFIDGKISGNSLVMNVSKKAIFDVNQFLGSAKVVIAEGATAYFDGSIDGTLPSNLSIETADEDATYAIGKTLYIGSRKGGYNMADDTKDAIIDHALAAIKNLVVRANSVIWGGENGALIDDDQDNKITIEDGVIFHGFRQLDDVASLNLTAGGEDTIIIGKATVNGGIKISDGAADTMDLNGTVVNTMDNQIIDSIVADGEDIVNINAQSVINGNITGGKELNITAAAVNGNIADVANVKAQDASVITGNITAGTATILSASVVKGDVNASEINVANAEITGTAKAAELNLNGGATIGVSDSALVTATAGDNTIKSANLLKNDDTNSKTIKADAGNVTIEELVSVSDDAENPNDGNQSVMAVNGGKVTFAEKSLKFEAADASITAGYARDHKDYTADGGEVAFNGDIEMKATNASIKAVNGAVLSGINNITQDADNAASIQIGDGSEDNAEVASFAANDVTQNAFTASIDIITADSAKLGNVNQTAEDSTLRTGSANLSIQSKEVTVGNITQTGAHIATAISGNATAGDINMKADSKLPLAAPTAQLDVTGNLTASEINLEAKTIGFNIGALKIDEEGVVTNGSESINAKSINLIADDTNTLDASIVIDRNYDEIGDQVLSKVLPAVEAGDLARVINAEIIQTSDENTASIGMTIKADGHYDDQIGFANPELHKAAVVKVDSYTGKFGNIKQGGEENTINALFEATATGESDVTIGKADITVGELTQVAEVEKDSAGGGNAMKIGAKLTLEDEKQAVMNVNGPVNVKSGKLRQVAFNTDNTLDIDGSINCSDDMALWKAAITLAVTIASIEMAAYNGTNDLTIDGNVKVEGDIIVGGVKDGDDTVDAWGDRTATENNVTIDVDTVTVGGKINMIGLQNTLKLTNSSNSAETITVDNEINMCGNTNIVDLAYNVVATNIGFYRLIDHDHIGQEEYELGTGIYTNTAIIRGTSTDITVAQENSNDTIKIYGGKVNGSITTQNGQDVIILGNDDDTLKVLGDATVTGNIIMGNKGAAEGTNSLTMAAFSTTVDDVTTTYNTLVGGNVEMYAGKMEDGTAASNTISMTGARTDDSSVTGKKITTTSTIGGNVTMDSVSFDKEDGKVYTDDSNSISMNIGSTIKGNVTMAAFNSNSLAAAAGVDETYKYSDVAVEDDYDTIGGSLTMTGDQNSVAVANGALYVNGITMAQTYADGDKTYLTTTDGTNAIDVGSVEGTDYTGAELIVGTDVKNPADVVMGVIAFENVDGKKTAYIADAREMDEKGHDVISYIGEKAADLAGITKSNTIYTVGRFTAKDVGMLADVNKLFVVGDGSLNKDMGGAISESKITEEVRTASLKTGEISQIGQTSNAISVSGRNTTVAVYGKVDDELVKVDEHASARVNTGKISQIGVALDPEAPVATSNTVQLTDSIVANTGDIEQIGAGTNYVRVDGFYNQYETAEPVFEASNVGNIDQTSTQAYDETEGVSYRDIVILDDTNVNGSIKQTSLGVNYIRVSGTKDPVKFVRADETESTYEKVFGVEVTGDVEQTGLFNAATYAGATVKGTTTQTSEAGNSLYAVSNATDAVKDITKGEACEYNGDAGHGADKDHKHETIKSQGAFNTMSIGNVIQTVKAPAEGDPVSYNENKNYATMYDMNFGDVTQTNAYGANYITANGGSVGMMETFVGEIETAEHTAVSKVAEYNDVTAVTAGAMTQEGNDNDIALTSVNAGAVAQTGKSGKNAAGVWVDASNEIRTYTVSDAKKVIKPVASWDTDHEVFTDTAFGQNKRAWNTLASIAQTTDASVSTTKADTDHDASNHAYLYNTSVTGDVTQSAVAENSKVCNDLGAYVTEQEIVEVTGTTTEYTIQTIGGNVAQTGYDNNIYLDKESVAGSITQTASYLTKYDDHGVLLSAEVGTNYIGCKGVSDEQMIELGNVTQTINNGLVSKDGVEKFDVSDNKFFGWDAQVGNVAMSIINGDNSFYLNGGSVASISASVNKDDAAKFDYNSTVTLIDVKAGSINTTNGKDVIMLTDSDAIGGISTGKDNDTIVVSLNAGKTSKIAGVIDMGDGADSVSFGDKVDTASAAIKNAELVTFNEADTVKVTALENNGIVTAGTAAKGIVADTVKNNGNIVASVLTAHEVELQSSNKLTVGKLVGTKVDDKLNVFGTLATNVTSFEDVTVGAGADISGVTWIFTDASKMNIQKSMNVGDSFAVGNISAGDNNLNFIVNGDKFAHVAGTNIWESTDKKLTYSGSSITLANK